MSNCLQQTQPNETSIQQQQVPPLQILKKGLQNFADNQEAELLLKQLSELMKKSEDQQFQNTLKLLSILFAKGYSNLFTEYPDLMRKMMNHFSKLSKQLENNNGQAQTKMLFILSLIAEMIKQSPKFYFPFTRKFLLNVFLIDHQALENSPQKSNILAILAVIYNNLSMQGRLINKLNIGKELKEALLNNYSHITEMFSLKLFNRSILNLASKGISFTSGEFTKHGIMETISAFITQNQVQMFLLRMKNCMFSPKPKNELKLVH